MGTWHKELGVILEERVVREGFRQAMKEPPLETVGRYWQQKPR